jgi:hypothetical protein
MSRDVPVGFTPDEKPNWGTRASFTSLRVTGMDDTVVARIERKTKLDANFIADAADRCGRKHGIRGTMAQQEIASKLVADRSAQRKLKRGPIQSIIRSVWLERKDEQREYLQ